MPTLPSGRVFVRRKGRRQFYFGNRSAVHPNYPECGPCEGEGWCLYPCGLDEATGRPTGGEVHTCSSCGGSGEAPANEAAPGLVRRQ